MIEGKLRLTTVGDTGRQFVAQSGTGHALVMDDADGHSGPKPIELALLAELSHFRVLGWVNSFLFSTGIAKVWPTNAAFQQERFPAGP
jgi:hypothetical protein